MAMSPLFRWLHRWRQRDDQHLVKPADPIDELRRLVNEAQERDAEENAGYGAIAGDVLATEPASMLAR
jgi:hypothetical protein